MPCSLAAECSWHCRSAESQALHCQLGLQQRLRMTFSRGLNRQDVGMGVMMPSWTCEDASDVAVHDWRASILVPPTYIAAMQLLTLLTVHGYAGLVRIDCRGSHVACFARQRRLQTTTSAPAPSKCTGSVTMPGSAAENCSRREVLVVMAGCYRVGPGFRWEGRLWRLTRMRIAYEEASAMLSTLGGGHFLCRHLDVAMNLADKQQQLALIAGDHRQAVRCGVHKCYVYMAAGKSSLALGALAMAAGLAVRLDVLQAAEAAAVLVAVENARASRRQPTAYHCCDDVEGTWREADASSSGAGSHATQLARQTHPALTPALTRLLGIDALSTAGASSGAGVECLAVEGVASTVAPRTAPPTSELGGMLVAAADYVRKVSSWLDEGSKARASSRTSDDFGRQRPGSKRWTPPVPQAWLAGARVVQ